MLKAGDNGCCDPAADLQSLADMIEDVVTGKGRGNDRSTLLTDEGGREKSKRKNQVIKAFRGGNLVGNQTRCVIYCKRNFH